MENNFTVEELAKIAFDAYNVQAGGKTWDGKKIPDWPDVGERVQNNWIAATVAILSAIEN